MSAPRPDADGRPRVLYLLTDELSSVLVGGQLGFLVDEGFEVTVACRWADREQPKRGAWDAGVAVEFLPFEREIAPLADLRALWATWRLIRRLRPVVVHASTPKAGLLGMLAAWSARVPVRVLLVRGYRFETTSGRRRWLLARLDRVAARLANHVVFNSASLRSVAERAGVVPAGVGEVIGHGSGNGVDTHRFAAARLPDAGRARAELGVPPGARVVGFVGRLTADKGVADLVDATLELRGSRPDVHLVLVGSSEPGDPLDTETQATIGSAAWITALPWLDDPTVVYGATDVLAFPSYREGLPNVALEAQACGVPVVGYAATGTVDAVRSGETGVLVEVGDTDALARELGALIDDPVRRTTLGRAGAAWVSDAYDRRRLWRAWSQRLQEW